MSDKIKLPSISELTMNLNPLVRSSPNTSPSSYSLSTIPKTSVDTHTVAVQSNTAAPGNNGPGNKAVATAPATTPITPPISKYSPGYTSPNHSVTELPPSPNSPQQYAYYYPYQYQGNYSNNYQYQNYPYYQVHPQQQQQQPQPQQQSQQQQMQPNNGVAGVHGGVNGVGINGGVNGAARGYYYNYNNYNYNNYMVPEIINKPVNKCHRCGTTETPEWRRGPNGVRTLCNACGLFHAKLVKRKGAVIAAQEVLNNRVCKGKNGRRIVIKNQI